MNSTNNTPHSDDLRHAHPAKADAADRPSTDPTPRKEGEEDAAVGNPSSGEGGTYEKDGPKPSRGNEMPEIEERIDEGDARNERIKIIHDPKRDDQDLDAFTGRVNAGDASPTRPENSITPKE